jgi:uncharacterized membrane protein
MPAERRPAEGTPRWVGPSALVLSAAGLAVATYLTIEHYTTDATLACPETGVVNCQAVTTSPQSMVLGIPVAVLGVVFFVGMLALTVPPAWRSTSAALRMARLGAAAMGVVWVIYLVAVELYIVDKICLWCTAVHVLTVALFALLAYGAATQTPGDAATRRV